MVVCVYEFLQVGLAGSSRTEPVMITGAGFLQASCPMSKHHMELVDKFNHINEFQFYLLLAQT